MPQQNKKPVVPPINAVPLDTKLDEVLAQLTYDTPGVNSDVTLDSQHYQVPLDLNNHTTMATLAFIDETWALSKTTADGLLQIVRQKGMADVSQTLLERNMLVGYTNFKTHRRRLDHLAAVLKSADYPAVVTRSYFALYQSMVVKVFLAEPFNTLLYRMDNLLNDQTLRDFLVNNKDNAYATEMLMPFFEALSTTFAKIDLDYLKILDWYKANMHVYTTTTLKRAKTLNADPAYLANIPYSASNAHRLWSFNRDRSERDTKVFTADYGATLDLLAKYAHLAVDTLYAYYLQYPLVAACIDPVNASIKDFPELAARNKAQTAALLNGAVMQENLAVLKQLILDNDVFIFFDLTKEVDMPAVNGVISVPLGVILPYSIAYLLQKAFLDSFRMVRQAIATTANEQFAVFDQQIASDVTAIKYASLTWTTAAKRNYPAGLWQFIKANRQRERKD